MHLHNVLMLAAVAMIWTFATGILLVTRLQRRAGLGPADTRVAFASYGPVLAGTASGGAAAVHLATIRSHAIDVPSADGAIAFICSVGADVHFPTVDATVAGYLPIGVLSIGFVVGQAIWTVPRLWQRRAGVAVGASVAILSAAIALDRWTFGAARLAGSAQPELAYADVLAFALELAVAGIAVMLVARRPRRLVDRLTVRAAEAWVGTGLGVAAVTSFAAAAVVVTLQPH